MIAEIIIDAANAIRIFLLSFRYSCNIDLIIFMQRPINSMEMMIITKKQTTKKMANSIKKKLDDSLKQGASTVNYGKMTQNKRLGALNKFKSKERLILLATDVASR